MLRRSSVTRTGDTEDMSSAEQTRVPMPSVLVVALTLVSVILLTIAVTFGPVAVLTLMWGANVGVVGIGVWILVAVLTLLVMVGRSWARFGLILLPFALGVVVLASEGVGLVSILFLGAVLGLVAVCLMFAPSANAYFRTVTARRQSAEAVSAAHA